MVELIDVTIHGLWKGIHMSEQTSQHEAVTTKVAATRRRPSFRSAALRFVSVAMAGLLLFGGIFSATQPADQAISANGSVTTVQIHKVVSYKGCSWGICTFKLNKAETAAVAAGSGVFIGAANIFLGAGYAAAAAYALEKNQCFWFSVAVWQPSRVHSSGLTKC